MRGVARLMPGVPDEEGVELLEKIGGGLRSWLLALAAQIAVTEPTWVTTGWASPGRLVECVAP